MKNKAALRVENIDYYYLYTWFLSVLSLDFCCMHHSTINWSLASDRIYFQNDKLDKVSLLTQQSHTKRISGFLPKDNPTWQFLRSSLLVELFSLNDGKSTPSLTHRLARSASFSADESAWCFISSLNRRRQTQKKGRCATQTLRCGATTFPTCVKFCEMSFAAPFALLNVRWHFYRCLNNFITTWRFQAGKKTALFGRARCYHNNPSAHNFYNMHISSWFRPLVGFHGNMRVVKEYLNLPCPSCASLWLFLLLVCAWDKPVVGS